MAVARNDTYSTAFIRKVASENNQTCPFGITKRHIEDKV